MSANEPLIGEVSMSDAHRTSNPSNDDAIHGLIRGLSRDPAFIGMHRAAELTVALKELLIQRANNERLRAALDKIAGMSRVVAWSDAPYIAHEALKGAADETISSREASFVPDTSRSEAKVAEGLSDEGKV